MERTNYIKVFFPCKVEGGFNESMWVLVDDDVKMLYDTDAEGMVCSGTLDNNSFYDPDLRHGKDVQFRMCGERIPEAVYA